MTRDRQFYSSLPYDIASDRLRQINVRGVNITVDEPQPDVTQFRLDLTKKTPIGTIVSAHLVGTVRPIANNKIQIAYYTRAFSRYIRLLLPAVGLSLSLILFLILSPEMAPIISAPGAASILIVLFWSLMESDIRKNDQFRLQELIERILEKQTTMLTWQA